MPAHPPLFIASVNMRKRNAVTHALLNSDNNTHLFLIQEPWFDKIGTARQDNARQGIDILGGVASPAWELLYPGFVANQRPKVMAYARKHTPQSSNTPHFSVVPRIDICAHPTLQVLDIILDNKEWRIINFYHDVRDKSSLQALLALDIDAVTPTLVIGDFNTHSRSWSPPDIPRSPWANRIEEWAATNLLSLANKPGEITRRGAKHERDSVIDLAWFNEAAIQAATFSGMRTDWQGNLGSDHALIHITGHTQEAFPCVTEDNLGFLIDPEKEEDWTNAFKTRSSPCLLPLTPSVDEIEKAAASFTEDVQRTNEEILRKRRPLHRKASPWWNAACAIAVQNLRNARTTETRGTAQARLKGTVRVAKRKWADEYIEKARLWDVVTWRHGRKLNNVPALQGPEGLSHSHEDVADILSQHFFPQTPLEVELTFPDDPPPIRHVY